MSKKEAFPIESGNALDSDGGEGEKQPLSRRRSPPLQVKLQVRLGFFIISPASIIFKHLLILR